MQVPNEDFLEHRYMVPLGREQVLGYRDIGKSTYPRDHHFWKELDRVADEQCAVEVAANGESATLYALGNDPTGYKFRKEDPWSWLRPGESVVMPHYSKVTLMEQFPQEAVFKLGDGYLLQQEEREMEAKQQQKRSPAY